MVNGLKLYWEDIRWFWRTLLRTAPLVKEEVPLKVRLLAASNAIHGPY